ncbi:MAG TPA: type IX secretion system membrane protein PorP/SprF [Flavobacteriaceae bacterium]|nr:type IX secretion system membrane protein PorP/SprF [Flavobacteriaceae bacterium]
MNNTQIIKGLFFCLFSSIFCGRANGQSDPKLSNYSFTPLTFNPAYAGSYGGLNISSLYSAQWTGIEGAPKTILVNGHDMFSDTQVGLGVDFMSDKIGATKNIRLAGNFAYHFNISKDWRISAGIKAGISSYSINYQLLTIENPGEFSGDLGEVTNNKPIIGAGFYVHTEKFYVGASVPNLIATSYVDEYKNTLASTTQNLFLSTGYNFKLYEKINLRPSLMTRIAKGAPVSTLASVNANWEEKFYVGINFEVDVSIGAFVGIRFMENFMFGYAYDTAVSKFIKYNGGIHSFSLNFRTSLMSNRKRCGCYQY